MNTEPFAQTGQSLNFQISCQGVPRHSSKYKVYIHSKLVCDMIKTYIKTAKMKLISARTILPKNSQNIKLLSAPPVQIKAANQCLNYKYTPSSVKGYLKTQKFSLKKIVG